MQMERTTISQRGYRTKIQLSGWKKKKARESRVGEPTLPIISCPTWAGIMHKGVR